MYHIHVPCEARHDKYRETVALTPFKQILTSLDPVNPQLYSIELSSISSELLKQVKLVKVVGEIRRAMSVTVVRANALCLMERLCQLGPGARAAAQRRHAALQLEERRRQERQAFDLAWQAQRSSRVGRAFIE